MISDPGRPIYDFQRVMSQKKVSDKTRYHRDPVEAKFLTWHDNLIKKCIALTKKALRVYN